MTPRVPPTAQRAALGALIAARSHDLGLHVIECAPGQFEVYLRVQGPSLDSGAAHRSARWLTDAVTALIGPVGQNNPRPVRIRPHITPRRPT